MIRDLVIKNRSYRRFDQSVKIDSDIIKSWIELARFSASGKNMQSLKYIVCTSEDVVNDIFPTLGWAGYLTDWNGPEEGERPVAYIAMIHDKNIDQNYFCDDGIASQSILLGAVEDGYGGCIFGTYNRSKVAKIIGLPENMSILWLIALGKPVEEVVLEDVKNKDIKYWRDEKQVHHVPKRSLEEIVLKDL
ncbi:MAG: nitroreductase family protein [Mariniphaga sp.]|nr:nitroreductase family protein [Mariniphaga sp.]